LTDRLIEPVEPQEDRKRVSAFHVDDVDVERFGEATLCRGSNDDERRC
jgi:hypothetical protein